MWVVGRLGRHAEKRVRIGWCGRWWVRGRVAGLTEQGSLLYLYQVYTLPLTGWLVVVVLVKKENGAITLLIIGDRPTPTPPLNHQQMEYENVKEEQQDDDDDASTGIGHQ